VQAEKQNSDRATPRVAIAELEKAWGGEEVVAFLFSFSSSAQGRQAEGKHTLPQQLTVLAWVFDGAVLAGGRILCHFDESILDEDLGCYDTSARRWR
jgi:hypothetical protein